MDRRRAAGALFALAACIACSTAAPMANQTALDLYDGAPEGCYYNFQHYGEGDRIMTNEPCLNCTCHNRMLMCYLRVCPFTKPIGQDCTVEKRADQCCPIVTCPDVPVDLLTSTSTSSTAEYGVTGIGKHDKYGCSIDGRYFPEGSKVPPTPNKPCEHCYCIRNMTTCVMQECTLHVDGCIPIYHKDVCCPVRYSCDHPEDEIPLLDDMTTTVRPTPGFLLTTTLSPVTQVSQDCVHDDQIFADGALIKTEKACEHCYCMKGDIVCVVQECGTPMENEGKNCTSLPPRHGQCCPDTYICEGEEVSTDQPLELTTEIIKITSTTPPRRGIEGSGYRNEPDEPYTDGPIFEIEGSGEEQSTLPIEISDKKLPEKQTPDFADEMFITTTKKLETKTDSSTSEPDMIDTVVSKSEATSSEQIHVSDDGVTESSKLDDEEGRITNSQNEDIETTPFDVLDNKVTQVPSTKLNEYFSTSFSGLSSNDDQYLKTTDSLYKKEDNTSVVTEVTTQMHNEITTENGYYEQKVIKDKGHVSLTSAPVTSSEYDKIDIETTSTTTNIDDVFQTKQTTTDVSTTASVTYEIEKERTDENILMSTMKLESPETSSVSNTENEIDEDLSLTTPSGRIPGEGDCLLNSLTYRNNASVPSTNKCHTSCKCVNSIISCDPITCSPPPEYTNMNNCLPIYDSTDSCCPTYICDHVKETDLPESHSQMSGTETPKSDHDNECSGNECQVNQDKQSTGPSHTIVSSHPGQPQCGTAGCINSESSPATTNTQDCTNGKCEQSQTVLPCDDNTKCHVTPVKPCEGDDCEIQLDVISKEKNPSFEEKESLCKDGICKTSSPKYQDDDSLEKECNDDTCRRKITSEDTSKLPSSCSGEQCKSLPETNEILQESTSQLPATSEETTITSNIDTFSKDYTINTVGKLTTILEETISTSSTNKIDNEIHDLTTKYPEIIKNVTDSSDAEELEPFNSEMPDLEKLPENSYNNTYEIRSTTSDIQNKQIFSTTLPQEVSKEPSAPKEKLEKIQPQGTTELEKEDNLFTVGPQTTSVLTHTIITSETEELSTAYPESHESTSQESFPYDHVKQTIVIEKQDKDITPGLSESTNIIESFTTESLIQVKDTEKDFFELPSTTLVTVKNKEDTTTKFYAEFSTLSPEYHEIKENFPEYSTFEGTEKTEQYSETTKISSESITIGSNDKYSTQDSKPSVTTIEYEVTTEYIKNVEQLADLSTEQTLGQKKPEKSSSQINDKLLTEQNEISSTTSVIDQYVENDKVTKTELYTTKIDMSNDTDKTQEDLFTKPPVIDVMESLNGRGTEIPSKVVEDELHSVTSHVGEEIKVTSESKPWSIGESQPEITTTETKHTPQTGYEEDGETNTSILFDFETPKTNAPTFDITESTKLSDEIVTEISKEGVSNYDKLSTNTPEKITTMRLDLLDDNIKEQDENEKKNDETSSESTTKPLKSTKLFETNEISTTPSHITEFLSTVPSLLLTENNVADVHEIELLTSTFYPEAEIETETFTESSDDRTKLPQPQEAEEVKYDLSTSTQIPNDVSATFSPDSFVSDIKPTSENILDISLPQRKPTTVIVTDNLSMGTLPPDSSDNAAKLITDSPEKQIITKWEDIITTKPHSTVKDFESAQTDFDKTTITLPSSEGTYPHDGKTENILISEEEGTQKLTVIPQSFSTEKWPESQVDMVTGKDIESSYADNMKATKDVKELITSKVAVTEPVTFTVKYPSNDVTNQKDITTEDITEKSKDGQYHTEPQFTIVNIGQDNKDEFPESTDSITSTKFDLGDIPSKSTYEILKVTELSKPELTEKGFTEKSEQTTVRASEINESFEENTINIGETESFNEYTTETLIKLSEIKDTDKKTIIPDKAATDQKEIEAVTDESLTSPEIKYTEKNTETSEEAKYTMDIITESPKLSSSEVSTIKDLGGLTYDPNKASTMTEFGEEWIGVTTESEKDIYLPEQKVPEQQPTEIAEAEKEKNIITEMAVTSTETISETYIIDDIKTSSVTEKILNEFTTSRPHHDTEKVSKHDEINNNRKILEVPKEITTQTSKLTEYTKEEKEIEKYDQDKTTEIPETSTFEIATIITEIKKDLGSSSYLPERTTDNVVVSVFNENDKERSTEYQEVSTSKFTENNDIDKNYLTTESFKLLITSSSNVGDSEKTESTFGYNDILENLTTAKSQPEESTEIQSLTSYRTSTNPESLESATSEKELPITVKVNVDSEDKLLAYTTEQYTEAIKEIITDLHDSQTENYAPPDKDVTTIIENGHTFSQEYHDIYTDIPESLITQKSESETQSLMSLSTKKVSYLTTEEDHISDGEISNKPDSNKFSDTNDLRTTELPASVITSQVEYSKPISASKEEHTHTTPYLVELEEHTHKGAPDVTSDIYYEIEASTVKYDTLFSEKDDYEITKEKQVLSDHKNITGNSIEENAVTSTENVEVITSILFDSEKDILYTTRKTYDISSESSTQYEKKTTPPSLFNETENIKTTTVLSERDSTYVPEGTTLSYEKKETPKQEEQTTMIEKESDDVTHKPYDSETSILESTASEEQFIPALTSNTTTKITEDVTTLPPIKPDKFTTPENRPTESIPSLSTSELHNKPGFSEMLPTDDIPSTDEDNHFPPTGSSGYGQEPDYGEEDQAFGPGTCRYGGKVYVSAQQIPRDDPCDFCFCFRSDIICLQQSCPPPIHGCHEEPIQGFCCPRYECPVSMAMTLNITTTTTTTTTTLPPHFLPHAYKGAAQRRGCQIKGHTYKVGEVVRASSGPCLHCTCGGDGQMKCDPKACTPEPILRQMIAAAVSAKRRR